MEKGRERPRRGRQRAKSRDWAEPGHAARAVRGAPNPNVFRMAAVNKFTAFGGLFAEGNEGFGAAAKGGKVFVRGAKGGLKSEGATVAKLMNEVGPAESVQIGGGEYAQIMLDSTSYCSDIEKGDIISKEKPDIPSAPAEEPPKPEKVLPPAKTYNDPDRKKHIIMATNDLFSIAASGGLAEKRQRARVAARGLRGARGFGATREAFISVKTRCPRVQRQLSALWGGVGAGPAKDGGEFV
jgi:hypothetical protein